MDRVTDWVASERAVAVLGYIVGALIGARLGQGGLSLHEWTWAGIAILGLIQLRLLTAEPVEQVSAEEA